MGVGVQVGFAAVGGPAGVGDASNVLFVGGDFLFWGRLGGRSDA